MLVGQRSEQLIIWARYLVRTAISACTMMSISEKLKLSGATLLTPYLIRA